MIDVIPGILLVGLGIGISNSGRFAIESNLGRLSTAANLLITSHELLLNETIHEPY